MTDSPPPERPVGVGDAGTLPDDERYVLELRPDELDLLRTGLELLIATLGREEADELEAALVLRDRLVSAKPA